MKQTANLIIILLLGASLSWAEPSVYAGGYGGGALSAKEKQMILSLRQRVNSLQEEVEGIRSMVSGFSEQINQLTRQVKSASNQQLLLDRIASLEDRLDNLEKRLQRQSSLLKRIKSSSSSKAKSSKRRSKSASSKSRSKSAATHSSKSDSKAKAKSDPLAKEKSSTLFSQAVRLINQKRYDEAKRRLEILESRKYKEAAINFYLGEIAYRSGQNDDAIRYYQKSAELNENAAYMDRLLLHTGIALERSGDRDQARNFFRAIVDGYPGTASARVAKRHLKK